jgi:hypothetical protein
MCTKSLESQINMKNAADILELAVRHNCPELKEEAVAFLGRLFILGFPLIDF